MSQSSVRLLLVCNAHIYRTPDGRYYAPSLYDNTFFNRYLKVFESVRFVAKIKNVNCIDPHSFIPIDASGLEIYELPWTQGMMELAKRLLVVLPRYRFAAEGQDCAIYRVAQIESYLAFIFRRRSHPFFLEVVNDPETFVHMPRFFRWVNELMLRAMLNRADGASFVTERILQKKYLPRDRSKDPSFALAHYSSIELEPSWIKRPRIFRTLSRVRIVHVSNSVDNDNKGHRTAISVVRKLRDHGIDATISFIGHGTAVDEFMLLSSALGVNDSVHFRGRIHDRAVLMEELEKADLFLYPTRLEGLPRAVIEAMAAGLPTLSTPIAGIPELLSVDYLFDPDDIDGFASAVLRLLRNPQELTRMSYDNVQVSKKFANNVLNNRRTSFYQKLRTLAHSGA